MRTAHVLVLSLSLCSCAAVFRGSKDRVRVESTPAGAEAHAGPRKVGPTPAEFEVDRAGVTQITLAKNGYEDHVGQVNKGMNPAWLTLDIATCLFTFCIPLLIDAVTGAWYDVDNRYVATMRPGTSATLTAAASASAAPSGSAAVATGPASAAAASHAPPAPPPPNMSESERKATARAAYLEGVAFQEKNNCNEALPRFEAAQKFFPAPTHQLHMAECQTSTGKLVEAVETFESLAHVSLDKGAPDAFKQAQDQGNKELAALRPRIPTLRVQVIPAASTLSSLVVKLNGNPLPNEVLGIARPVNPGHYKVTVWAAGYKEASSEVDLAESTPKVVELKLSK